MLINRRRKNQGKLNMSGLKDVISGEAVTDSSTSAAYYIHPSTGELITVAAVSPIFHPVLGVPSFGEIVQACRHSERPINWYTSTNDSLKTTTMLTGVSHGPFEEADITNFSSTQGRSYFYPKAGVVNTSARIHFSIRYKPGTSGNIFVVFRNSTKALEAYYRGVIGEATITQNTGVGIISIVSDELDSSLGYRVLVGNILWKNLEDSFFIGIGSNVSGKSIKAIGADAAQNPAIKDFHLPDDVDIVASRAGSATFKNLSTKLPKLYEALGSNVVLEFDWVPGHENGQAPGVIMSCGSMEIAYTSKYSVRLTDGTNMAEVPAVNWKKNVPIHIKCVAGDSKMRIIVDGFPSKVVPYVGTFNPSDVLTLGGSSYWLSGVKDIRVPEYKPDFAPSFYDRTDIYGSILTEIKWTPTASTMPTQNAHWPFAISEGFIEGTEYTGVPYSGVYHNGRWVGFDIYLKTFLAAVANPKSVLYTTRLTATAETEDSNGDIIPGTFKPYYGTVCSGFVSYATGCSALYRSNDCVSGGSDREGVGPIGSKLSKDVKVGDLVWEVGGHIAVVTDTIIDATGKVSHVRYQESWPPTTNPWAVSPSGIFGGRDKNGPPWVPLTDGWFTADQFSSFLIASPSLSRDLYRVFDEHSWHNGNTAGRFLMPDYEEDAKAKDAVINRTLLLDRGDWVVYWKPDTTISPNSPTDYTGKGKPVKFNILDLDDIGVRRLEVKRGGVIVTDVAVNKGDVKEIFYHEAGEYTAYCRTEFNTISQVCEFSICDLSMTLPVGQVSISEGYRIYFTSSSNMKPIYVELSQAIDAYQRYFLYITDLDRARGFLIVPPGFVKKAGGLIGHYLYGENKYGRLCNLKTISGSLVKV